MKRAIFFVLLLALEAALFSQNLIVNPGFESWGKINKPTGWTTAQNCLKDSVYIKSGSYSCRHEGGTSTKYLGQMLPVIPGKQYKFSFYYRTETTGTGHGCRIWCYWKDADGINVKDSLSDDIMRPSQYLKSDTWLQFSISVIAPPDAVTFYLEVRTNTNSVAYWDDFVFEVNMATYIPEENYSEIKLYPNPAHNYLTINNLHKLQHIDIQTLTGLILWSSNYSGEETVRIPVSGLPDGLYLVNILSSDKRIIKKFIKKAD